MNAGRHTAVLRRVARERTSNGPSTSAVLPASPSQTKPALALPVATRRTAGSATIAEARAPTASVAATSADRGARAVSSRLTRPLGSYRAKLEPHAIGSGAGHHALLEQP